MILYSPAKINIGLKVIKRRQDGFHDLQSVMFPTGLCDIIEIRKTGRPESGIILSRSGIPLEEGSGKNLCVLAYEILAGQTNLPRVEVHLHKQIPVGAGLGGGSSNAANLLKGLNSMATLPVSRNLLHELSAGLGSDCPFFLNNRPMMMEGRGEILSPVDVRLQQMYLVLLFPGIHISTAEAYAGIRPGNSGPHLGKLITEPVEMWKDLIINDFEVTVFEKYPVLSRLKSELYGRGALYASLSGSGSSVYGIFKDHPELPDNLERIAVWKGTIRTEPGENPWEPALPA